MTDLDLFPAPTITPGHRLVPALIGFHGQVPQTVWIECPTWCIETHHASAQLAVEDIIHAGDAEHLGIHTMEKPGMVFELYAQLKSDPAAADPRMRQASVVVDDGGGEDAFLTPDMADALADDLIGFASQLRHLARTARLHNDITSTVGGAR
ncbi:hypothetical protein ABZX77_17805 [Streptomyces sp. NPDC004237]|uniref:DUF6907 domain-containing protein n=1 Tax=Streptomyces sp. NPDC004237 TaxID=3154455 RepID=UPI0033B52ED9